MTIAALLPFVAQTPSSSAATTAAGSSSSSSSASPAPSSVVSIRTAQISGTITAAAGDVLAISSLYAATAATGGTIAGYQVALRSDQDAPNDGTLELNGVDVTHQISFTPDQFAQLHYVAGPDGSRQDLLVVAQSGKTSAAGTLTQVSDSTAVQITANITGTRSVNAAGALLRASTGDDATFLSVAKQASIFTGFGSNKPPTLTTVGNVTIAAGDTLTLSSLYTATAPTGSSIAGYQVAVRGGGTLELNGADVTTQTSFTADQFAQLHFVAGDDGSSQDLVVVAQTGTRDSTGTLTRITDSAAVSITADVTGTRSVNAAGALLTAPTGDDANFLSVTKQASIFNGFGSNTPPALTTLGNVTVVAGDTLAIGSLYTATAPSVGTIAGYQVAVRGGGTLELNGADVTAQTSFTADQFAQLHFVAGDDGSSQDLVVVAQTGIRDSTGTLTRITDSAAVSITAGVTGTRSVNAAGALLTAPTGDDANFLSVAKQASIFTGFGTNTPPAVSTVGNVTVAAGDTLALGSLYTATAPSGTSIAGYQVAVRGGGTLELNGADVTTQTSFTADQFAQLHFVAGTDGSSQDLVVVAQTGTRDSTGTLTRITDSAAVSITAGVTGTRSVNAAGALLTASSGDDANFLSVAKQASIFTGFGTNTPPTLTTVGNITVAAGDTLALGSLYAATAPSGSSVAGYQVAVRGGGTLELNGADVTAQTSFTADQFAQLHFVAGDDGSSQHLVVVAQTGTRDSTGTLTRITDSAAISITAGVTGTRSVNEAGALLTQASGNDSDFLSVAKAASIFTGFGTNTPPTLTAIGTPLPPPTPAAQLSALPGMYQTSAAVAAAKAATAVSLLSLYPDSVGGFQSTAKPTALPGPPFDSTAIGGQQTGGGNLALHLLAVAAYQASQRSS